MLERDSGPIGALSLGPRRLAPTSSTRGPVHRVAPCRDRARLTAPKSSAMRIGSSSLALIKLADPSPHSSYRPPPHHLDAPSTIQLTLTLLGSLFSSSRRPAISSDDRRQLTANHGRVHPSEREQAQEAQPRRATQPHVGQLRGPDDTDQVPPPDEHVR